MKKVYLDHNATSPVHPDVRDAILPLLNERFGNPSSAHWAGAEVRALEVEARGHVAALIGAMPEEIVFTAGGTESDNMALRGAVDNGRGGHIITTAVEHPAVLYTARSLGDLTVIPVDGRGMIDPDDVRKAIRKDTALISVMHVNNETGNIYPIEEIARIAREHDVLFHTDAVQSVGKLPIDVKALGVDMLSASGHKFNAIKGVGFQYIRDGVKIKPLLTGGGQERGNRAGTENMPGIVAIGKACEIARAGMSARIVMLGALRARIESVILNTIDETLINGHPEGRIYNTSNISFKFIESEAALVALDLCGIAVSSGSACSSSSSAPSRILSAMGLDPVCSRGALRFSLGLGNTDADVDYLFECLIPIVQRLQKMSPFFPKK